MALSPPDSDRPSRLVLGSPPVDRPLTFTANTGAGVHIGVDLLAPHRWCTVALARPDGDAEPVLRALIGRSAAAELRRFRPTPPDCGGSSRLRVDPSGAEPWLRVAVLDALDRWLQLPLEQALVDAERGIARGRAAQSLPAHGPARAMIVGEALRLARHASRGLVRYLRGVGAARRPLPAGLHTAIENLVNGYTELIAEVSGPDRELSAVLECWRVVTDRLAGPPRRRPAPGTGGAPTEAPAAPRLRSTRARARLSSMIDPRQVRARVLALSADPALAEIMLVRTKLADRAAVSVRVPAYRRSPDQEIVDRLLVRLVDRHAPDVHSEGLLTLSSGSGGDEPYFQGTVPLRGSTVDALRADIFDALSDVPPAVADADEVLQEARRASVFLGEWRQLAAAGRLPAAGTAPAQLLRELAKRLDPTDRNHGSETPTFAGGPSTADLDRLADLGDEELLDRLRSSSPAGDSGWPDDGLFMLVRGPGELMVAELAALHSRPAA